MDRFVEALRMLEEGRNVEALVEMTATLGAEDLPGPRHLLIEDGRVSRFLTTFDPRTLSDQVAD